MTHKDLGMAGLVETGARIAKKEVSPVEVTKAMLERVEAFQPKLHAYATVMADEAMADAKRAEEELSRGEVRGPLHGVPVAVKDLCFTKGVSTASGIPALMKFKPEFDATVVEKLRAAGAVILGKIQLTEGALGTHHPDVTIPVNPWNKAMWSGASSSGSGVATAAGLAFGTLGSDTGGSIRFPSYSNHCVGLKPTWGRVSRYGVFPLSESLDHVGPLTRKVEDAAAMMAAISGLDPKDPTTRPEPVPDYLAEMAKGAKGLRIGYDEAYCSKGVEARVTDAIRRALDILKDAGAEIVPVTMPDTSGALGGWVAICAPEAALAHKATYPSRKEIYSEAFGGFLQAGLDLTAADYAAAHIARLNFTGALRLVLEKVDMMISPVMSTSVPTHDRLMEILDAPDGLETLIRFTGPHDSAGVPTITLPAGFDGKDEILGFQLVAWQMGEPALFRAGKAYQDAAGWPQVPPAA
ncbi:amidase [Marinibaculum pumilum]|uniref:Amidase n=1 Tax=Marinibaculum pumilum TaxID=1766165 RepID=A0ABV7L1L4_9PROT